MHRDRQITFTLSAPKAALILLVLFCFGVIAAGVAGCSTSQKASVTKAFTGYADPGVTDPEASGTQPSTQPAQPATSSSIEGMTQTIGTAAAVAAGVPSPLQPLFLFLAALSPTVLLVERAIVRGVALLPNSQTSASSSGSLSAGAQTLTPTPAATSGSGSSIPLPPASNVPPAQATLNPAVLAVAAGVAR